MLHTSVLIEFSTKRTITLFNDKLSKLRKNMSIYSQGFTLQYKPYDTSSTIFGSSLSSARSLADDEEYVHLQPEFYVVVQALWNQLHYLLGKVCIIYSDYEAIKHLNSKKMFDRRHGRWSKFIQGYHYVIKYKAGMENLNADALSQQSHLLTTLAVKVVGLNLLKEIMSRTKFSIRFRKIWLWDYWESVPNTSFATTLSLLRHEIVYSWFFISEVHYLGDAFWQTRWTLWAW